MADNREKEIAEHEVWHAIVAYCCSIKIKRLTMQGPIEDTTPQELRTPYYCELSGDSKGSLERMKPGEVFEKVLINLAPATLAAADKGASTGAVNDILEIINYLSWPLMEPQEVQRLVDLARSIKLKYPDDPRQQALEFFREHKETVERFTDLPQVRQAHKFLTDLLLQRGMLSGYEVASCLERFDLPGEPLPAREHYCQPVGATPQTALEASRRMLQIAFNVLSDGGALENPHCEQAREAVLAAIFRLEEIISAGGDPFTG